MAELNQDLENGLDLIRKAFYGSSKSTGPAKTRNVYKGVSGTADATDEELEELAKSAGKLTDILDELATTAETVDETMQDTGATVKVTNKKYTDLIEKANAVIIASSGSFRKLEREVTYLSTKSLPEQDRFLKSYSSSVKSLTNKFSQQARSSSMLSASMIASSHEIQRGTTEYHEMIGSLQGAAGSLNQGLLRALGAWDESTNGVKHGLDKNVFAALRLKAGEAEVALNDAVAELDVGTIGDIAKMGTDQIKEMLSDTTETQKKVKKQIIAAAAQLAGMGYNVGDKVMTEGQVDYGKLENLRTKNGMSDLVEVVKELAEIQKQNAKYSGKADATANLANSPLGAAMFKLKGLQTELGNTQGGFKKLGVLTRFFGKSLFEAGAAAKYFGDFKEAVKKGWSEIVSFNTAQIPASFKNVQIASMKMGMSFEDTVKFMQQNKRAMGIYGDNFGAFTGNVGKSFRKFGYNMEQASEIVGPAMDAAASGFTNLKGADALPKFIDKSMQSFKRISGIVDISAADYMKLNAELLSNSSIQNTLLGMSQQQREAAADEIVARRDNYVQLGLSTAQAQKLVEAQEAQQREGVVSRVREGAKAMMLAAQAGMSPQEQMRIMQLARKGRKTDAEKTELQQLAGRAGAGIERRVTDAYGQSEGAGEAAQTLAELISPGGELGNMINAGKELAQKKAAGLDVDDATAKKMGDKSQGSAAVADISQTLNQISSVMKNTFVVALLSGTAALAAFIFSLRGASKSLPGGGGMLGGIVRGGGGMLGKGLGAIGGLGAKAATKLGGGLGSVLGKGAGLATRGGGALGRFAAGGAGKIGAKAVGKSLLKKIPLIGLLAGLGFGASRALSGDWTGAGLEVASGAASTVPGLGTAGSLAIDAGLAARDIAKAQPSVSQPGQEAESSSVNNLSDTSSTNDEGERVANVQDATAHDYLATIADNMVKAVTVLQAMAAAGNEGPQRAVAARLNSQARQIPTANGFITGRQAPG